MTDTIAMHRINTLCQQAKTAEFHQLRKILDAIERITNEEMKRGNDENEIANANYHHHIAGLNNRQRSGDGAV